MSLEKAEALQGINVKSLTSFLALAGVAMFLPFFIHIQWITGPIINAVLILVLFLSGIRSAVIVALVPSLMAMSGGLLPIVLSPMVPFIMISNIIYIFFIDYIYHRSKTENGGYWAGILTGSVVKFLFLLLSITALTKLITKKELTLKIAQILSWPQLATAIAGGFLAWVILKWLRRI